MYNIMILKNKEDKPVFSVLPSEQQRQVFLWNKGETLKKIHLMSKDNILGLVADGHWSFEEVFTALTESQTLGSNNDNKISEALGLLKEMENERINISTK